MNERKQTGRKADYLCSGLVYCQCGAKMHVLKTHRKGYEYIYYACSEKCGAHTLRMEDVDRAAIKYLYELLSEDNQRSIAKAMREYQAGKGSRMEEFKAVLKKRTGEKQRQYDALMMNLSSGELPAEVVADIGAQMKQLNLRNCAGFELSREPLCVAMSIYHPLVKKTRLTVKDFHGETLLMIHRNWSHYVDDLRDSASDATGDGLVESRSGLNCSGFFVYRKPLARRVVQNKASADDVERKTPFGVE